MLKLIKYKGEKRHFAEEDQDNSVVFAPAMCDGNTITELTQSFRCKDFLSDLYPAAEHDQSYVVYGFKAEPEVLPKMNSLVMGGLCHEMVGIKENIQVLHTLERHIGYSKTKIEDIGGSLGILINDPAWIASPWSLSLYTLLLRCLSYEVPFNSGRRTFNQLVGHLLEAKYEVTDFRSLCTVASIGLPVLYELLICNKEHPLLHTSIPKQELLTRGITSFHSNAGIVALATAIKRGWVGKQIHPQTQLYLNHFKSNNVKIN